MMSFFGAPVAGAPAAITAPAAGKKIKTKAKRPPPSVCLDYLKGQCTRHQCRYEHPDLAQFHPAGPEVEGVQVCEVYVLTGRCKFGSKCIKLHPKKAQKAAAPPVPATVDPVPVPPPVAVAPPAAEMRGDAEAEFQVFADSLLGPFAAIEDEDEFLPDLKAGPTGKKGYRFDQIFMDILRDLNLVSF